MEQRTLKQNSASHLWYQEMAEALNNAGITIDIVMSHGKWDVNWTPELFKEVVMRNFANAIYHKTKTSEMTTQELSTLIDTVTDSFAKEFGIFVDFPSNEEDNDVYIKK